MKRRLFQGLVAFIGASRPPMPCSESDKNHNEAGLEWLRPVVFAEPGGERSCSECSWPTISHRRLRLEKHLSLSLYLSHTHTRTSTQRALPSCHPAQQADGGHLFIRNISSLLSSGDFTPCLFSSSGANEDVFVKMMEYLAEDLYLASRSH